MAIVEVKVPELSESVADATLLQWKKQPGEAVELDEVLIELETDKVVLEVPAPSAGVLTEIVENEGATVTAGQVLARIDTEAVAGASAPAPAPSETEAPPSSEDASVAAAPAPSGPADIVEVQVPELSESVADATLLQWKKQVIIGLVLGLAGGTFSVGTPYVARWFPRARQGMAMGVFGAGNSGAAVNKFLAPVLIVAFGWAAVPHVYAAIMLGTLILFWFFSHSNPAHRVPGNTRFVDQLKVLKDPNVIKYCQYYSIVFGGYVALALWMVQYYVSEYNLDIRLAALLAACFSLPGGVLRAVGGMLSDKYGAHKVTWWVMWVSWICLFLLSYPQTEFTIQTVNGARSFHIGLNVYGFTALMFILGIAWAFGKASVFKYISDDYTDNIGAVSGIVGLAGGLGGFVLPILFGALMDLLGFRSSAFMLLYGVVWVSLIWMYFTEVRTVDVIHPTGPPTLGRPTPATAGERE